jgi:hypothetical protein
VRLETLMKKPEVELNTRIPDASRRPTAVS